MIPHSRCLDMTELTVHGMPGRYWHLTEDGRIQCDVCPRFCKLHEGQRGLCFVRARHDGQMVLRARQEISESRRWLPSTSPCRFSQRAELHDPTKRPFRYSG